MRMPPPVRLTGHADERNYQSPQFTMGSLTTITLYHDYICPWCYVGFFQAMRLTQEHGVIFDWRGSELLPPSMEFTPSPPKPVDPDAPPRQPGRFDLFAEAEGLVPPEPRPAFVRSHHALLGQEFARRADAVAGGTAQVVAYNEGVYRAFWEQREDIADVTVLSRIAGSLGWDVAAFAAAIEAEQDLNNIVPYDDDAYATGIRHLPLFVFGGEEMLAEAPYASLAAATANFLFRQAKYQEKG